MRQAEQPVRLPLAVALPRLVACVGRTAGLLARGRVHRPRGWLRARLRFADGSSSRVYRETTLDRAPAADPCALVVEFRLRWVRGFGHRVFRAESLLNTPLFVGFPGFVSKLWMAADENGVYRGIYEWDGPDRADAYVRALWWALAVVSDTRSIRYRVLPGMRRDELLAATQRVEALVPAEPGQWWRPLVPR
jgi:hypothetical protein